MTVLPIVERELRVGARNPLLFRSRFMVPLIGAVMFIFTVYSLHKGAPPNKVGPTLLHISFGMIFAACIFGGVQTTADTISREKREGTLGFLFLTDLKGYDIVIGKLVSSSISGVYSLFGILPVICIIFLLGGVELGTVIRLAVCCGNALFLSLSAGLFASVLCVDERRSRGLAGAIVAGMLVGGAAVGAAWLWATGGLDRAGATDWAPFLVTSPFFGYLSAAAPSMVGGGSGFYASFAITQATAWSLLGLACWLAPRTWQEKSSQKREAKWQELWRKFTRGNPEQAAIRRAGMLDENAIYWLTNRDVWKGRLVWLLWGTVVLGFAVVIIKFGWDAVDPSMAVALIFVLNAAMKLSMAGESSRWLSQDRQNGGLELILTTTLTIEDIIRGQRKSLRNLYLWPFMAAGALQLAFLLVSLERANVRDEGYGVSLYFMVISLAVMAADFEALAWVGMWKGLSANPAEKARQQTVNALLIMPWVLFYFGGIACSCFMGIMVVFVFLPGVMFGVAGWWTNRAKLRFRAEFRARAMERYSPPPKLPFWKRIGQMLDDLVTPDHTPNP